MNEGAAANRAGRPRDQQRANDRRCDERVRIDEDERVTGCDTAAGVARGSDVPDVHGHHARARLTRDLGRPIRRSVVNDDDLAENAGGVAGRANRLQRRGDQALLVVSRNDK